MRNQSVDSSSSSDSLEQAVKFKTIYARQLKKKQALEVKRKEKEREQIMNRMRPKLEEQPHPTAVSRDCLPLCPSDRLQVEVLEYPVELQWFVYPKCPKLDIDRRVPSPMNELPIFRKKEAIMEAIIKNQFVLVTGETGCGKSTQVPRLIYEYLRSTNQNAKIMCVQPRRIAVVNLQQILERQMREKQRIGYQIGMKSHISGSDHIVFVTNGIFLQRLVHSTDFFKEYPFIILDEVHERDIDTDFILLTIKRIIRQHPRVRVVLMSATIDNELFKYYFAQDHIDSLLTQENFYKKVIRLKAEHRQQKMEDEDYHHDSDSNEDDKIYAANSLAFMKARHPCPAINVTEPGKYTRTFHYLDTLQNFLPKGVLNSRWGSVIFSQKYPSTHKQLYESTCLVIEEIVRRCEDRSRKASVLIFMPGLGEIENLNEQIRLHFTASRCEKLFELINVHSTILNEQITDRLLEGTGSRHKVIISTNIAESSITVMGVEYVIDFCLSKEVRFDIRSKMENLELVWASKASCKQRAGRTGRVCHGTIIRLLEKDFYTKLLDYSTPEIQRSSLDRLILRIKLLHEGEKNDVFAEPGEVLGSAIQPPNLRNIDTAINSLKFSGGLEWRDGQFFLTSLGRLYVDVPIDITYTKLLVVSQLFGTFHDVLCLVAILSQSKNAIRRGTIQRSYTSYYDLVSNPHNCDFLGLLALHERTKDNARQRERDIIRLEVFSEVTDLRNDIERRINKRKELFPLLDHQVRRKWKLTHSPKQRAVDASEAEIEDYLLRFKLTLVCGFVEHVLKVREACLDEKQEKRLNLMKRMGIRHANTLCVLGSSILRKPDSQEAEKRLVKLWQDHLYRAALITSSEFTITHGLSYVHFNDENQLHKFLFYQYVESSKKSFRGEEGPTDSSKNFVPMTSILNCFGETDHMHGGRLVTFTREQTVHVDNYSLNRVVNANEGAPPKFLVTNNIAKQSSRMVARYTSLLPASVPYVETVAHLLFYPFVTIAPNADNNRYDCIQLAKRKNRILIKHDISREEVEGANEIRALLRGYLELRPDQPSSHFSCFWEKVKAFVALPRPEVIEQDRWQLIYLRELFKRSPELKAGFDAMMSFEAQEEKVVRVDEESGERYFMNEIRLAKLSAHFFSNVSIAGTSLEQRAEDYNLWKQAKLKEVRAIERKAEDRDSYLGCGEDSCGLRVAKLVKVGPVSGEIFRDLYEVERENVVELEFNDMDCHFCTLLMSNYISQEYKTFGCTNGHYFAIQLAGEHKLKILPFSELMLLYPDGSAEKADFERLDVKHWKRKHDEKSQGKYRLKLSTYCFVCDEVLDTFKNLELHIRDLQHSENVRDLVKALPHQLREPRGLEKAEQFNY